MIESLYTWTTKNIVIFVLIQYPTFYMRKLSFFNVRLIGLCPIDHLMRQESITQTFPHLTDNYFLTFNSGGHDYNKYVNLIACVRVQT